MERMKQQLRLYGPGRVLAAGDAGDAAVLGRVPETTTETNVESQLSVRHALRVQAARYWLELGEADEALRELEALPSRAWRHPVAVEVRLAALHVGGDRL
jgi:hypothetical protein